MNQIILKAIANDLRGFSQIKSEMDCGKKINAIKEIREVGKRQTGTYFGLKDSKDFIEGYYRAGCWIDPDISRFHNDVLKARIGKTPKKKKGTKKVIALQYDFQGADLRQVDTDSLMALLKTLRKELKKRGEKI